MSGGSEPRSFYFCRRDVLELTRDVALGARQRVVALEAALRPVGLDDRRVLLDPTGPVVLEPGVVAALTDQLVVRVALVAGA